MALLAMLFACKEEPAKQQKTVQGRYKNLAKGVGYAGMDKCRECHADVYETFIKTGMGQSLRQGVKAMSNAIFDNHAVVYNEEKDLYYKPFLHNDSLYVLEYRLSGKDTIHRRIEKISYIVGSGHHTNSHFVDINGYFYQAPITFYTQDSVWDMAPGFADKGNNRFDRYLMPECITCHNNLPEFESKSLNKYPKMPTGIQCERCHGPGQLHVQARETGQAVTVPDYSIVNPARLPKQLVMDLCIRCHLQGITTLNPGHSFFDFKPGMELHSVMNVFLPRFTDSDLRFIMASQADRFMQSTCYKESENFTCITCHNPHITVENTPVEHFNSVCLSCHSKEKCSEDTETRQMENENCVSCHMPKSGSIDIPHVKITDHYIHRKNVKGNRFPDTPKEEAFVRLELLTKKKGSPLEMAEGYLALYDKWYATGEILDSIRWFIDKSKRPFREKLITVVHYYFAKEDYDELIKTLSKTAPEEITDPWTCYRIGEAFYKKGDFVSALIYHKKAVKGMKYNLDFQEKLGTTYLALNKREKAKKTFEFILHENPKRPVALTNLGYIYILEMNIRKSLELYDKAIALDPDYEQALMNKAAVMLLTKKKKQANNLLKRVLKINPDNIQARRMLGDNSL